MLISEVPVKCNDRLAFQALCIYALLHGSTASGLAQILIGNYIPGLFCEYRRCPTVSFTGSYCESPHSSHSLTLLLQAPAAWTHGMKRTTWLTSSRMPPTSPPSVVSFPRALGECCVHILTTIWCFLLDERILLIHLGSIPRSM